MDKMDTQNNMDVLSCQENMLVDIMESHFIQSLQEGRSWGEHILPKHVWNEIATILNGMGPPFKDGTTWSEYFDYLKSESKKKVLLFRKELNKTGGGPASKLKLTDLDTKLLMIYGKDHFDGLQNLGERGLVGRKFEPVVALDNVAAKPLAQRQATSGEVGGKPSSDGSYRFLTASQSKAARRNTVIKSASKHRTAMQPMKQRVHNQSVLVTTRRKPQRPSSTIVSGSLNQLNKRIPNAQRQVTSDGATSQMREKPPPVDSNKSFDSTQSDAALRGRTNRPLKKGGLTTNHLRGQRPLVGMNDIPPAMKSTSKRRNIAMQLMSDDTVNESATTITRRKLPRRPTHTIVSSRKHQFNHTMPNTQRQAISVPSSTQPTGTIVISDSLRKFLSDKLSYSNSNESNARSLPEPTISLQRAASVTSPDSLTPNDCNITSVALDPIPKPINAQQRTALLSPISIHSDDDDLNISSVPEQRAALSSPISIHSDDDNWNTPSISEDEGERMRQTSSRSDDEDWNTPSVSQTRGRHMRNPYSSYEMVTLSMNEQSRFIEEFREQNRVSTQIFTEIRDVLSSLTESIIMLE